MLSNDIKATTFAIIDTTRYAPVFTLSTQDNAKLSQKLKSAFKRTINWKKYQSKVTIQAPNSNLDYLINPSVQGINWLFVFLLENAAARASHTKYYLPTVEIKMIILQLI